MILRVVLAKTAKFRKGQKALKGTIDCYEDSNTHGFPLEHWNVIRKI